MWYYVDLNELCLKAKAKTNKCIFEHILLYLLLLEAIHQVVLFIVESSVGALTHEAYVLL